MIVCNLVFWQWVFNHQTRFVDQLFGCLQETRDEWSPTLLVDFHDSSQVPQVMDIAPGVGQELILDLGGPEVVDQGREAEQNINLVHGSLAPLMMRCQ